MSDQPVKAYFDEVTATYRNLPESLTDPVDIVAYQVLLHRPGSTKSWYKGGTNVMDCPEFDVARIASPFSNEQRVRVSKAIYQGKHTFAELREETGLNPGQLQHHLKELALANFLVATGQRNHYELSNRGKALLLLMLAIGKWQTDTEGEELYLSPDGVEAG